MKRPLTGLLGAIVVAAAAIGSTQADAGTWRSRGLIGGMSAAEVLAWPDSPYHDYRYYAGYHVRPIGPPPGCVIRRQRVWNAYGWTWRKLRICH
ncbi:hypothetical protein [Pseudorhodoplanes sp.]|jgi:hypothetical protein|uniref:hypothetical protein n=1 Tax=Pseudorhodoplanes sp. TaxID=1934341 RepID=UPI002C96872C|nr:hypothetical protein [Pseudorhodoplanes sp.]HWV40761.1 hypothetical protein [Pseudorhodoplanes sp.]